jgi:hypothetical protein
MEEHLKSVFIKPENENIKIWRFMNFPKYVSLLENQDLYFSSAKNMPDEFEGVAPRRNVEKLNKTFEKIGVSTELAKLANDNLELFKKTVLVNCWHMNDDESDTMWGKYVRDDVGVVIQSTFKKFESVFSEYSDIHLGIIRYINFEIEETPKGNFYHDFLHKRKQFTGDQELRAITHYKTDSNPVSEEELNSITGRSVKINLNELIEKIYVSPTSPAWFLELTKSVTKKFGITAPVEESTISQKPDYV